MKKFKVGDIFMGAAKSFKPFKLEITEVLEDKYLIKYWWVGHYNSTNYHSSEEQLDFFIRQYETTQSQLFKALC